MSKDTRLVYETGSGRIRSDPEIQPSINPVDSICNVRLERKGRGGKVVTVIWNIPGSEKELKFVAKAIKQNLGTGGTAKNGQIIIQGDYVEAVFGFFEQKGYRIKKAGG